MTEENKKTSVFGDSLVWFGAAVSIAEILTGTLFAPLGMLKGTAAIVIGHVIGCILLHCAGLLGARYTRSAMETAKLTFGQRGGQVFATLNVLQLVGWTAVMIAAGAASSQVAYAFSCGKWVWAVIIGALILVWVFAGIGVFEKLNIVTVVLLFGLSIVLSRLVFGGNGAASSGEALRFGDALELSIAMPVSWLPLIADYTSNSKRPQLSSLASSAVYFVVSCWMYIIGMAAAIYSGESEIASIMVKAGLGLGAVLIVVLSTVTTTFLDVYSAAVSSESILSSLPRKLVAAAVCVIGVLLAIFCNTSAFENFLYLIGSVFVPMITVQIVDTLVLKRSYEGQKYVARNLVLWGIGFILYRIALKLNLPCGSTIPVMAACAVLCLIFPAKKK